MPEAFDDSHEDDLRAVMLPSGGVFYVYEREVGYFQERVKKYTKDNHFTNISDLATLDQVLTFELLIWRWTTWLSQQKDYWSDPVNEAGTAKSIKETSAELRQLKGTLAIDKLTRDKQRGEDSVTAYLGNLRIRAKEFGIVRESQLDKALELFNQLKALITLHDNCDDQERKEMGCTQADVIAWIRKTAVPEYDVIDEHFRSHQQKMWIREQ